MVRPVTQTDPLRRGSWHARGRHHFILRRERFAPGNCSTGASLRAFGIAQRTPSSQCQWQVCSFLPGRCRCRIAFLDF
jgi:hypothetical protein